MHMPFITRLINFVPFLLFLMVRSVMTAAGVELLVCYYSVFSFYLQPMLMRSVHIISREIHGMIAILFVYSKL